MTTSRCCPSSLHLDPCLGVCAQEICDEQHDVISIGVIRGVPVLADDSGEAIRMFKHCRLDFGCDEALFMGVFRVFKGGCVAE